MAYFLPAALAPDSQFWIKQKMGMQKRITRGFTTHSFSDQMIIFIVAPTINAPRTLNRIMFKLKREPLNQKFPADDYEH